MDKLKNRATQVEQVSRIQAIIPGDMFITGNLFFTQQTVSLFPPNIRLDEDVLNMSFVFVFRRRLQNVFNTSWSRRIYSP